MIENNVIINFTSGLNTREIAQILPEILSVMGLSVLNREVVKLKIKPQEGEYQLIINTELTTTQEKAIRNLFGYFKYRIHWSDFDNFDDK
uniref:Uncharacterized protein n=1 Tax=Podoviridae sp. ct53O25 TaxID=2826539 RepID=A0A8S5MBV3_9CAUD|nr:MAG TPA: hypothetical protein [Podoviridae sp. ct53O25]